MFFFNIDESELHLPRENTGRLCAKVIAAYQCNEL